MTDQDVLEHLHCKRDRRVCVGRRYCSCQCDKCFEAYAGRPRTPEETQAMKMRDWSEK